MTIEAIEKTDAVSAQVICSECKAEVSAIVPNGADYAPVGIVEMDYLDCGATLIIGYTYTE